MVIISSLILPLGFAIKTQIKSTNESQNDRQVTSKGNTILYFIYQIV